MHTSTPRTEEHYKCITGDKRARGRTPEFCRLLEQEVIMLESSLKSLMKAVKENDKKKIDEEYLQADATIEIINELRKTPE